MWALISVAVAQCLVVNGRNPAGDAMQVRMNAGRIEAVGASVSSNGCTVAEVPGTAVLTPGLVQVGSAVGLAEVDAERATVDNSGDGDGVRPTLVVTDSYNPASVRVPVVRLGGVTSVVVRPFDGLIAGQAGWARTAGARQSDAVVDSSVAMVGSMGGSSKAQQLDRLAELLEEARAYAQNRAKIQAGAYRALPDGVSARELEALLPVAEGKQPLWIQADRAADIEALLRLVDRLGIRIVLEGATEGWKVREELAERSIPVIVDPFVYGAGSFDQVHGRPDNAALLDEAGVVVMFRSWSHNAPISSQLAGNAVRGGMNHQAALDAITINPAIAFGQPAHTGLKPGNAADLVAWSGDPLEVGSRPLLVVVNGVIQPLDSRQKALFRKYRTLPGSPGAPLDLPTK